MRNAKQYINFYKKMLFIREVENMIAAKYSEQEMRCPVHLSIGQEAVAVGVCENLKITDQVLSAHRSHAHYLAKGGSLNAMIGELYGKEIGCAKGKGGSMHLIDINAGVVAAVPIVGSTLPIAVGVAWGNKLKKNDKITCVFFGDGATEEGVFQESLDFAALHKLKILFVCENNLYSVYSHLKKRQSPNRKICNISKSLGVVANKYFGNDIINTYKNVKKAISYIKKNNSPYLLEFDTYRHLEHCGPNIDDHLNYRSKKEVVYWKSKCPILLAKKSLLKNKICDESYLENYRQKIIKKINKSFLKAKVSPFPNKKELMKDIYA